MAAVNGEANPIEMGERRPPNLMVIVWEGSDQGRLDGLPVTDDQPRPCVG